MARKKPTCNICGKPVKEFVNGYEDDGGLYWCDECGDEFYNRVGLLIDQMRKEKQAAKNND